MNAARLCSIAIALLVAAPAHAAPLGPVTKGKATKGPITGKRTRPGLSQYAGSRPKKNHGVYLGHRGAIDTGYALDDFFHADHTLAAWWMPHFPTAGYGPIFGNSGSGKFFIGQMNYHQGNGGTKKKGNPGFFVKVGNSYAKYLLSDDDYVDGKWVHIAVTRKNGTFTLYVNGTRQNPVKVVDSKVSAAPEVKVGTSYSHRPKGMLVLGQTSQDDAWQAYGLLDDVGLYGKALSRDEIRTLMSRQRLSGTEKHLTQAWTFDKFTDRGVLTARLDGPWSRDGHVYHVPLTSDRRGRQDGVQLDNPIFVGETHVPVKLPFKVGEAWRVIQGVDSSTGSHNGPDAFCWDFKLAKGRDDTLYPNGTEYAPVVSGADGLLRSYSKLGTVEEREPYALSVEIGGDEAMYYLHLDDEYFTDKATGGEHHPDPTWRRFPEGKKPKIAEGEFLARLGPKAEHLHFCFSDDNGPMPGAFVNYLVSEDQGASWTKVYRGIPKYGQWIKRVE